MSRSLIIHHDNVIFDLFDNDIYFEYDTDETVDSYITKEIIAELIEYDFDIIFIKDNLSNNYLELLGLQVAYHMRLSIELEDKRYVPIVILSDVDSYTLNNFEPAAQILFSKNLFLINNTKNQIEKIKSKQFSNLTKEEYQTNFLNRITVKPPKDYLSHHGIANEWSIYRWAEFLGADTDDSIRANKEKIETMLYFKYLKELYRKADEQTDKKIRAFSDKTKGNILFIDDEWSKGWSDILAKIFKDNDDINFQTFEYGFKDKSISGLIDEIDYKKEQIHNADVVVLDLRLIEQDHNENTNIENYSGIKILENIHEINAGIQVIMLTATSKSTILEKLYEKRILGYIKKEHPEDNSIGTIDNINKFIGLVEKGLKNKYLKNIWQTHKKMNSILNQDPFSQYISSLENYESYLLNLKKDIEYIFDILNSSKENKFNYALVSMATSLEKIVSIFLHEPRKGDVLLFWDKMPTYSLYDRSRLEDKITKIINKRFGNQDEIKLEELIKHRNDYMHSNKNYKAVTAEKIIEWFSTLYQIIDTINNPLNYVPYVDTKKTKKHHNFHKNK